MWYRRESHFCRVAVSTVWSHLACEFSSSEACCELLYLVRVYELSVQGESKKYPTPKKDLNNILAYMVSQILPSNKQFISTYVYQIWRVCIKILWTGVHLVQLLTLHMSSRTASTSSTRMNGRQNYQPQSVKLSRLLEAYHNLQRKPQNNSRVEGRTAADLNCLAIEIHCWRYEGLPQATRGLCVSWWRIFWT